MKHLALGRIALAIALIGSTGVAHAAYTSYEEALSAARVQFNKGDYTAAQKTVEEALPLAKTPFEKGDGLFHLGLALDKRKLYSSARQQWTKVLQLKGVSAAQKSSAQSMIAGSYAEEKNWNQSRIEFQKVLDAPEVTPLDKLTVQAAIATGYGEEGNWSQSRIEFQKVLDAPVATPLDKAVARLSIAGSFSNQGNPVAERKELMAINDDPAVDINMRGLALTQVGQSYLLDKNFADARATFILSRDLPGVAEQIRMASQVGIGRTYEGEGNAAQAQKEFFLAQVAAVEESKRYSGLKQYASARALLTQALTFGTPKPSLDASMRDNIAGFFLEENNPEQARVVLEDLLKRSYPAMSPSEETDVLLVKQSAQMLIARSYIQQRQTAKARQILKALLAQNQLNPDVKASAQKTLDSLS